MLGKRYFFCFYFDDRCSVISFVIVVISVCVYHILLYSTVFFLNGLFKLKQKSKTVNMTNFNLLHWTDGDSRG